MQHQRAQDTEKYVGNATALQDWAGHCPAERRIFFGFGCFYWNLLARRTDAGPLPYEFNEFDICEDNWLYRTVFDSTLSLVFCRRKISASQAANLQT